MSAAPTNWIDFLIALGPVVSALVWAAVTIILIWTFKGAVYRLVDSVVERVRGGDRITSPWLSFERAAEREREIVRTVADNIRSELPGSGGTSREGAETFVETAKIEEAIRSAEKNFVQIKFPVKDFPNVSAKDTYINLFMTDWSIVSEFLNEIYLSAKDAGLNIPIWTYGEYWTLRNTRTGNVIVKVPEHSRAEGRVDSRAFSEIDVSPGDVLVAERV